MIEIDILPASSEKKGGDSALIRIGTFSYNKKENRQKVILIDGGYGENSERINKYLSDYYQTNIIDIVIISHPDMDHISGFKKLLDDNLISVKKTYIHDPWNHTGKIFNKTEDGRRTLNSIKNSFDETLKILSDTLDKVDKINTEPFGVEKIVSFDGIKIYIVGPSKKYYESLLYEFPGMEGEKGYSNSDIYSEREVDYSENMKHFLDNPITSAKNNSSTIILIHDECDMPIALFTGDAGVEAISNALDMADKEGLIYDSVKLFQIPHHGSIKNISEELITRINPKKTYVSAPPNKVEHPSRLLLNYLDNKGYVVRHIKDKLGIRFSFGDVPSRPGWSAVPAFQKYKKIFKLLFG